MSDQPVDQTPESGASSTVDNLKAWLRSFAERRLNLPLAHARKTFAPHVFQDLGRAGILGMRIPKEYGGLGLTHSEFIAVVEQVGAIDVSLAVIVGLNNLLGIQPILSFGTDEQKRRLLPELAKGRGLAAFAITEAIAGSNLKAIQASATPTADGVEISGEKIWIGLASWANSINVFVKELDRQGRPIGISAFLVDPNQEGVSFGPEAMTMGVQPIVQTPLVMNAVKVRAENRLGEPGRGLVVANVAMNLTRFGLLRIELGAMKRCYLIAESFVSRRQINTGEMLENGNVLRRMAQMAHSITALEALSDAVARRLDAGQAVSEELFMICKIAGPELLWEVVDTAMQLCGGRGYIEANDLPAIMRDARLLRIFEGPTEALSYYLGALVVSAGSARLKDNLDQRDLFPFVQLETHREQLRAVKENAESQKAYHVGACCLGELVAITTLRTLVGATTPAGRWLGMRYQTKAHEMSVDHGNPDDLSADAVTQTAAKYRNHVGFVKPALAGEEWRQTLADFPADARRPKV